MALEDRYQLIRKLGEGAMGIVYLYNDTWLKREVAIKRVKFGDDDEPEARRKASQRLIQEAQLTASLKHPNIVSIYDVIPDEHSPSIIMEYVKGKTLGQTARLGCPATTEMAIRVLRECADALDYAHSRFRVHRDFKPGNVMLDENGASLVLDFGLAKSLDLSTESTKGMVMGTFEYMSSEQLKGDKVDGRSDQYSLAVVAYQLLTGCRLYDAPNVEALIFRKIADNPAPATSRNAGLPRDVDGVLAKALSKDAAKRYGSCTAFVAELVAALSPPGGQPAPEAQDNVKTVVMVRRNLAGVRVNVKDGQHYVWIPPGTFRMGCSPDDTECYEDEAPAHDVTISRGFWMGETPVTEAAFRRFAQAKNRAMPVPVDPAYREKAPADDLLPVVSMTWEEAQAYCQWAGGRLPTEAEWEYAARAGTTGARYGTLDEIAWCRNNSLGPTPVRLKRPNAFGLYDMLGNVWEWTADWYGKNYYEANDQKDPAGPHDGNTRALRGGSWYDYPRSARVSCRSRLGPGYRYDVIGFRCVMD